MTRPTLHRATSRRPATALIARLSKASSLLCTSALLLLTPTPRAVGASKPTAGAAAPSTISLGTRTLPLLFEENRGQASPDIRFLSHTPEGILAFTGREIRLACPAGHDPVSLAVSGAKDALDVQAGKATGGVANYYTGNDPSRWIQGIPLQSAVTYRAAAQGVALVFHGESGKLEYDVQVEPYGDASALALQPGSGNHFHLEKDGSATLQAASAVAGCEAIHFHAPVAFQQHGAQRVAVASSFVLDTAGKLGFKLGAYNHDAPLTIDPVVSYTSVIGENNNTAVSALQIDPAGDVFITGQTASTNYPVTGGGLPGLGPGGSEQVYVTKLDPTGANVLYSTYLPSSGFSSAAAIALDASGNAYVAGITGATNFPTTSQNLGACGSFCNAGFVAKLSTTGTLVYSTLLGSGQQLPKAITIDAAGDAFVAGLSVDAGLQTVNAFQPNYTAGLCTTCGSTFFGELNPDGTHWVFSSYFYGTGFMNASTLATAIARDAQGDIFLAGNGTSVPLKHSFQSGTGGSFVAEFAPDGKSLLFSTLLGGNTIQPDSLGGMQVAQDGTIYLAGAQTAQDFPYTVAGSSHATYPIGYAQGQPYIFASAINPQRTGYTWSTYLGQGTVTSTALDVGGNFYVGGTFSTGSIAFKNALASDMGSGAYILELAPSGSLLSATGFGGKNVAQVPSGMAVDEQGNVYISGSPQGSGNSTLSTQILDPINVGTGLAYTSQAALGQNSSFVSYSTFLAKISPQSAPQISLSLQGPVLALRNAGSADLHIDSIVPSSGITSIINTCGSTVAAGSSCYLTPLSSTPTGNTLTINSNAQPASQTFAPTGLSAAPGSQVFFDFGQLNFPPQENGTAGAGRPLIITNAGSSSAAVTSILTFGVFRQTSNCGAPLLPGTSCTAMITANPTANSDSNADIGVVLGNSMRVDGFAYFRQNPTDGPLLLSVNQYGLGYGSVLIGNTSLLRLVTVTNSGLAPVTVADPTVTGTAAGNFSIAANTCAGIALQPQASCVIGATFHPAASGYLSAMLQVTGGGSSLQAALTGTGVAAPSFSLNPSAPDFGEVLVGSTATLPVQLTNTGTAPLNVTDLRITVPAGASQSDFSQANTCPASLAPQVSCTVTLTFAPSVTGARSGTLGILVNNGIVSQDLTLTGTGAMRLTVNPASLSFPSTAVGGSSTQSLTLQNQSTSAQPFTVAVASPFSIASSTCTSPLAAGAQCSLIVGFQPSSAGDQSSALTIQAGSPSSPISVALSGTATSTVTPSINFTLPNQTFGAAPFALAATSNSPGTLSYAVVSGPATIVGAILTVTGAGTVTVQVTQAAAPGFLATTQNATFPVAQAKPQIAWTTPAGITYGTALSAKQLDASASVPGSFTYSPAAGLAPATGSISLSATFTPTDAADYTSATASTSLTVAPAPLTVTAGSATRSYGANNQAFTATLDGAVNGDMLTASATSAAAPLSPVGTYTIVPTVTGASLGNYTVSPVNGTLTIVQAGTALTLSSNAGTVPVGTNVSFSAAVTSITSGVPTGSVQFVLNGTSTLATVPLTNGTATFSTAALAAGTDIVSAVYSGDGNFKASQSASLSETLVVPDFSVAVTPATLSLKRGQSGTATFTVTPINGFNQAVALACGPLPSTITCSFQPPSVTPSAGPVSSVLTVSAAPQTVAGLGTPPAGQGGFGQRARLGRWIAMACLLPLFSLRRRRARAITLTLLLGCWLTGLSGCGGGAPALVGGAPLGTSQVTVTVSSGAAGTASQHVANLAITITE